MTEQEQQQEEPIKIKKIRCGKKIKRPVRERAMPPIWGKREIFEETRNEPEFKPSKKTWTWFGNERLNWGVNWQKTAKDIIDAGYGLKSLANEMELTCEDIEKLLSGDLSPLDFKLGARLLAIEERFYPERIPRP